MSSALSHGPRPPTPDVASGAALEGRRPRNRPILQPLRQTNRRTRSKDHPVRIHLVNPSDVSFGTAVITPRWLYVLAAATPDRYGDAGDRRRDTRAIRRQTASDAATSSASASTRPTRCAGITWAGSRVHEGRSSSLAASTPLCSRTKCESTELPTPSSTGDGDLVWPASCVIAKPTSQNRSTRAAASTATRSRPRDGICCRPIATCGRSVQTVRGCPKHCSFCSVWRTDGQKPRQRDVGAVVREIVALRREGLSIHRARGRQLLSGDARRPGGGGPSCRQGAAGRVDDAAAGAIRADGAAWNSCPTTWCSTRRSRWRRPRIPSFSPP